MSGTGISQCSDFMQFQKALKNLRVIDDKIIYALNLSIPTASIQEKHHIDSREKCRALQQDLLDAYDTRENAIKKCINIAAEEVLEAKEKHYGTLRLKQGTVCLGFVKKKSTGESSCMTFIAGVVMTFVWCNYGLLINDGILQIVNGTGLCLQTCYTVCFYYFTIGKTKLTKQLFSTFCFLCMVAGYINSNSDKESTIYNIGLLGAFLSISYCAAPLASVSLVFKTRSTEVLPYYLILATSLVTLQWSIYGAILQDNFVKIPNMIGLIISLAQLSLFLYFPDKKTAKSTIIIS